MGRQKGKTYRGSTPMNADQEIGRVVTKCSENPETVPFKMPIAPIKVKESSEGKYLSKMLVAGTLKGVLTRGR